MQALRATVELSNVSLKLGGKDVLKNISAFFPITDSTEVQLAKHLVAVIGPSGSGKTVFLKLIATLLKPSTGKIKLFGTEVNFGKKKSLIELRNQIGFQFQNFALFDSLTVGENVAYPLLANSEISYADVRPQVLLALRRVGMEGAEFLLPHELSGGMKRRVAIARATVKPQKIAIFDDPIAGLDPLNSRRIMRLIAKYAIESGTLIFIASHDIDRLTRFCDSLVMLRQGRIMYSGPITGVSLSDCKKLKDFLSARSSFI